MDNETRENISNFLREYKRAMQEFQDSPEAEAIVQTLKAVNDFNTQLATSLEESGLLEVMRDFSGSLEKIRPALEYLSQYEPALYEQVDDVLAQVEPDEEAKSFLDKFGKLKKLDATDISVILSTLSNISGNAPEAYKDALLLLNVIFLFIYLFKHLHEDN